MSYRIGLVTAQNFGPFKSIEFDFGQPGLTVIEGHMVGHSGCDSNGSGKSFLIEAPVWCLTGRLIRDRVEVDDVVHNYQDGTEVCTHVVGGPAKIEIRRYRKHPKHGNNVQLFVDGENVTRGTNPEMDRSIERELGIDFTTFMNTVAFGARTDTRSFFSAPDGDRKAIMRRLLGLEVYDFAQKIARERHKEVSDKISRIMEREINIASLLMEQETFLGRLEERGTDDDVSLELDEAGAKIRILRKVIEKQGNLWLQAKLDLEAEIEHFREKGVERRALLDEIERETSKLNKQLEKAARDGGAADSRIRGIQGQIKRLKSLVDSECPTCLQTLSKDKAARAVGILEEELEEESTRAQSTVDAIESLRAQVTEIEARREAIPLRPSRWAVETVEEECQIEHTKLTRLEVRLEAAINQKNDLKRRHERSASSMLETIRVRIHDLRKEQDELVAEKAQLQTQADRLDFWVEGFGNGGLPSYLIESELPAINQSATTFAARLLGSGTSVCLLPTKQLKKGDVREKMVVEARIPGCSQNYAGASKGQRHRLDLSLILALREVVSRRSTAAFDQLFCDELFDGVDAAGIECVTEILHELAADRPVILVTHDARLKSIGDRVVTVTHKDGVARL